jgi:hypothetical protein
MAEDSQEPCFICGQTTVEHDECAPHGKCPTCGEVVCTAFWWSYSNWTDKCIFCAPDQRPEDCPCDEVEACECLENAKKGIRGHEPTFAECRARWR